MVILIAKCSAASHQVRDPANEIANCALTRSSPGRWQSDMLDRIAAEAFFRSDFLALATRGSYHRKVGLNRWSDLDLGVVMTDQAYLCHDIDAVTELLPSPAEIWCSAVNPSLFHTTHRFVYQDLRRVDIVVVPAHVLTPDYFKQHDCTVVFDRLPSSPAKQAHSRGNSFRMTSDPFEPAGAPRQFSDIANAVKFDAQLALFHIARHDLLEHVRVRFRIRQHILELARSQAFDAHCQISDSATTGASDPDPSVGAGVSSHVQHLLYLVHVFARSYRALTSVELDTEPLKLLADEVVRACPDAIHLGPPTSFEHWLPTKSGH